MPVRKAMAESEKSEGAVARLVAAFADLPGIGRRTAERLAYHVLMPSPTRSGRSRRISIPAGSAAI